MLLGTTVELGFSCKRDEDKSAKDSDRRRCWSKRLDMKLSKRDVILYNLCSIVTADM